MRSVSEKIDERILRLLGLEDVFDLDYDTYLTLLKEAIVTGAKKLPQEELALLANERKRVRGKKGRFSPKKEKITADKVATTKLLKPAKKKLAFPPAPTTSPEEGVVGGFVGIRKTLDSILSTLGSKFKFEQKQADKDRKEKETEKRGKREASLEGFKKGVAGIVATTKKMLDPFQAIIDRIWKFVFFTLLGRAFTKFMDWMSDKGNQEKFNSFIEFLTDHWPALAGLYILFGTSFGKLVRGLLKGVTRMTVALLTNIPRIASFIKRKPRIAGLLFSTAALTSGYISREVKDIFSDKKESPEAGLIPTKNPDLDQAKQDVDKAANTKVPTLNLGGMVPKFNLGGMLPTFAMGGMDFSGGVPITGAGQDDTLIAAKTGEAILTEKDQQDIGQRYVDRNTGQPLNIPQYLAGRKPGSVAMDNLRFPGFGGGFFNGGMISKFNNGGVVGGGGFSSGTSQFGEAPLIKAALSSGIKGQELAAFLAQMSHETGGFKWSKELGGGEGMGYSGGSRYHGRGYTQLTHDYNYKHFGEKLGVDLVKDPDLLLKDPNLSAKVAIEYWKERVRPKVKNWNDTFQVSAAINNPSAIEPSQINQYEDRLKKSKYYSKNLSKIIQRYQPKTDARVNRQRLIDKRPWWDKFGWFGGASRQIQKKQGGGLIETPSIIPGLPNELGGGGGGTDALTEQAKVKTFGSAIKGFLFGEPKDIQDSQRYNGGGEITPESLEKNYISGQKSGMNPEVLRAIGDEAFLLKHFGVGGAWRHFKGSGATDMQGNILPMRRQGGGLIKENTGKNIKGATADRQLIAAQPGEFVIPVDTVNRLGTSFFEKLVAMTDSNSNAYLGKGTVKRPQITPYSSSGSNRGGMITLPPITQSAGGSRARSAGLGGGSEVPEFSATAPGNERATNASIYGLAG